MDLRAHWRICFADEHGVGFMSSVGCRYPGAGALLVNASADGNEIISRDYDIGIASSTRPGSACVTQRNHFAEIERQTARIRHRRNGKLPLEALQGGTFFITNGGLGLMSTPIINPRVGHLGCIHHAAPGRRKRPGCYLSHDVITQLATIALSMVRKPQTWWQYELLESPEQLLLTLARAPMSTTLDGHGGPGGGVVAPRAAQNGPSMY